MASAQGTSARVSEAAPRRVSVVVIDADAATHQAIASAASIREQTADDCEVRVVPGLAELADAVATTNAEFVTWLDAGDRLEPRALEHVLAATNDDADFLYTDEDELRVDGLTANPRLKPDWSPDRLRVYPYTGRLAVFRRTTLDEVGGIRPELGPAFDHDVALRMSERARRIVHVPEVLCHRRLTDSRPSPVEAPAAAVRAVAEHLERVGFRATVEHDSERPRLLRLRPALTTWPPVSIIIPTGGHRRVVHGKLLNLAANSVSSVVRRSTYPDYEIVCVVDDGTDDAAIDELVAAGGDKLRMIPYGQEFNFARKINLGVLHARNDFLVFLNDDTEVISPDWIESLLMFAREPTTGAVGAKLRFADRRLQHVGVIAVDGNVGHPYYGFPAEFDGHMDNARTPTNCIAVTAACLMTVRDRFEAVGGLSLQFPLNYNDIDFGLKLWHSGYRNVFDPYAELYHFETSSRATGSVSDIELETLRERWGRILRRDPYYNPGFGRLSDFEVPLSAPGAEG
jgi:O-antigen biosynthesis protein